MNCPGYCRIGRSCLCDIPLWPKISDADRVKLWRLQVRVKRLRDRYDAMPWPRDLEEELNKICLENILAQIENELDALLENLYPIKT